MSDEVRTQHLIDALGEISRIAGEKPPDEAVKEIKSYCDNLIYIADSFKNVEKDPDKYNQERERWRKRAKPTPGVIDNGCL